MQTEPNRSPNSGELREVVVHPQERTLCIPPDTRALARLQREREAEKSDAPEKMPMSAALKQRGSPSPSHVLVHSPRYSYIASAQSYRSQPTATGSHQRPSPRQLYPSPPPQFYHPLKQAPSQQMVKQETTVSRGTSSRDGHINSKEETAMSASTNGFLPRQALQPPPAPLVPIHRPPPQAPIQDPSRAMIELSSSNTPSLRNAQGIRIPRS
uniref:ZM domain-containing protein n=1 Tax=Ascaris lumbricoides TaxID=6252 RepID=A0A0M3I2J4_ASCLU